MNEFSFTKKVNLSQIQEEIEHSLITIAIQGISVESEVLKIKFKANLSDEEQTILIAIVDSHVAKPLENHAQKVELSAQTAQDGIPYVYSTSKPLGFYTCYQGADDDMTAENPIDGIGRGEKLTFRLTSKTEEVSKYFTFNENIYVKDGYMIVKDAPFGATVDIEIVHPLYGVLMPFGRSIPIFGTGWFPLNTNDRGYIPKGLQIKITAYNSQGSEDNLYEETPATFSLFGRFELYRPTPPIANM